jgi:thiamine pyrophosphokinase
VRPGKAVDTAIARADLLITADSGTTSALHYGRTPTFVVGDFDSINPEELAQLKAQGSQIISAKVEKNETDTELAVQTALAQGATSITLLGALGGARFDHTLANILLLAGFETLPMRIVDGPSTAWLLRGPGSTTISGQESDLLSLLPLTGNASGVRTGGLYYPLRDETLYFGKPRGVSNVLVQENAEVSLAEGLLLIIHTDVQELE